jgi:hypothetical protein
LPALSYTNFRVSGLILRSLILFEMILVQGNRHGSSFCRQITTFQATFVEEAVYSPLYIFVAFVKNKVGIAV